MHPEYRPCLIDAWREIKSAAARVRYEPMRVPRFLISSGFSDGWLRIRDPGDFFLQTFHEIETGVHQQEGSRDTTKSGLTYIWHPRAFASLNSQAGNHLHQIVLIPFLVKLGVSRVLMLPNAQIGIARRKGTRGSPFAIRNPFCHDAKLGDEPLSSFVPAGTQYQAFVAAANMCGIEVGSVVPVATLAIDSPLLVSCPELSYWWRRPADDLHFVRKSAPTPSRPWQPEFGEASDRPDECVPPPVSAEYFRVGEDLMIRGWMGDRSTASPVHLVNATPDVLAGDASCYTWRDVVALNFWRDSTPQVMGHRRALSDEDRARPAWHLAAFNLAWRARMLGETRFVIDVGKTVPPSVLDLARRIDAHWCAEMATVGARLAALDTAPDREVFDELALIASDLAPSPVISRISYTSEELVEMGVTEASPYEGVVGPLPYAVGAHWANPAVMLGSLRYHTERIAAGAASGRYLATASTHDTNPPSPVILTLLWPFLALLPRGEFAAYSGSEFGSRIITNAEFGFSSTQELRDARDSLAEDDLALFGDKVVDWASANLSIATSLCRLLALLVRVRRLVVAESEGEILVQDFGDAVWGYRRLEQGKCEGAAVVVNWSEEPVVLGPLDNMQTQIMVTSTDRGPTTALEKACEARFVVPARSAVLGFRAAFECKLAASTAGLT